MKTICRPFLISLHAAMSCIPVATISAASDAQYEVLLLPDQEREVDELEVPGTETSQLPGVRRMDVPGMRNPYLIVDRVTSFEKQVADTLSSIYRYDSDISIFFGFIKGEFLHLSLSGPDAGTAIYVIGEPWLFMQIRDIAESESGLRGTGTLKLREFKFPFTKCATLADKVDQIVSAVQRGAASIGSRPPPKKYWVLDGAHYSLKVRFYDTEIAVGVGGNSELLFEPVNSAVQLVRTCADAGLDYTVGRHELSDGIVKERLVEEDPEGLGVER